MSYASPVPKERSDMDKAIAFLRPGSLAHHR
jgi:hypothetical protein